MRILKIAVVVLAALVTITGIAFRLSSIGTYDAPVITCDADDTIITSVNCTDEELLSHVTAEDKQDGDITDSVVVTRKKFFVDNKTTLITFSVCDSDDNVTSLEKKVYYEDYTSPKIILTNDFIFPSGVTFELSNYVKVTDMIDGDLTTHAKLISTGYSTSEGSYYVNIKVSNSMADSTSITVKAIVTNDDYGQYRVRLKEYITYAKVGDTIDYNSYLDNVINKAETTYTVNDVVVDSHEVDMSKPGCYDVYYRILSAGEEPETISMSRLVVVVEEA